MTDPHVTDRGGGVLVFGRTGQVARELARLAPAAAFLDRAAADLGQPDACAAIIRDRRPRVVINAAAWTAVDAAETEEATALVVNAAAPGAMARACADLSIPLLHVSSDYVFDGGGDRPRTPQDPTRPLSAYGRAKLAGEQAIIEAGGVHLILRTSWVFSAHGANFLKTMLRLGHQHDHLDVVADQVGGPTPADAVAGALLKAAAMLEQGAAGGVHHLSGAPDVSWADFARVIFKTAGLTCQVRDIATADRPTLARRPLNSRLDCSSLEAVFGVPRPDWRIAVRRIVHELKELSA